MGSVRPDPPALRENIRIPRRRGAPCQSKHAEIPAPKVTRFDLS
jgi:hypothetical protein